MNTGRQEYIYAVWVQTDDFYDDGHLVSFYKSPHNAAMEATRLLGTTITGVSIVTSTDVERVELHE